MFVTTHIIGGLIIGKLTGNYIPALMGATLIDLDHLIMYAKHRLLLSPQKLLKIVLNKEDVLGHQRNFLHSIFMFTPICFILFFIDFDFAFSFSIGYTCHLIFDALDNADFYPLFPWKKINLHGPIEYFSKQEFVFALILFVLWVI
jgi:membrane-bound metal-dependent hydrolase YbcI (DUF457 family)